MGSEMSKTERYDIECEDWEPLPTMRVPDFDAINEAFQVIINELKDADQDYVYNMAQYVDYDIAGLLEKVHAQAGALAVAAAEYEKIRLEHYQARMSWKK